MGTLPGLSPAAQGVGGSEGDRDQLWGQGAGWHLCPVPGRAALGLWLLARSGADTTHVLQELSGPRVRDRSQALCELIKRFLMERKLG